MDAFTICIAVTVIALLGFACNHRMEVVARRTVYESEDKIYRKAREEASEAAYAKIQETLQKVKDQSGVMTRQTTVVMQALKNSLRDFDWQWTEIHNQQRELQKMQEKTKALLEAAPAVKEAHDMLDNLKQQLKGWVSSISWTQAVDVVEARVPPKYRGEYYGIPGGSCN